MQDQHLFLIQKYFVALEGQMEYAPTRFKNARLKKDASLTKGVPKPKVKRKKVQYIDLIIE